MKNNIYFLINNFLFHHLLIFNFNLKNALLIKKLFFYIISFYNLLYYLLYIIFFNSFILKKFIN